VEKKPDENDYNCKISINDTQKKKGSSATLPFMKTDKLLCRVTLTQPIHTRMPELGCKGRVNFEIRVF
jgi:hypothetical protein